MRRQFCDRCTADVTDKHSAAVRVVAHADVEGNGAVTTSADLCLRCLRALGLWLQTAPPPPRDHHRKASA